MKPILAKGQFLEPIGEYGDYQFYRTINYSRVVTGFQINQKGRHLKSPYTFDKVVEFARNVLNIKGIDLKCDNATKVSKIHLVGLKLKSSGHITPTWAINALNYQRLSSGIHKLRGQGWKIETDLQKGKDCNYAKYILL